MRLDVITPEVELSTGFILDARGRIVSTREPHPSRGPLLSIIRSATACAWAVRDDVADDTANRIAALLVTEPLERDLRLPPIHAATYLSLTGGQVGFAGPEFTFPQELTADPNVVVVKDERLLQRHFHGWQPGEIAAGCAPVLAVLSDGYPVSVCFCARRAQYTAAAGLETAAAFRGRGFGPRVTAAWALAVRATGRTPLYSAAWSNAASLAVARKLRLVDQASFWSICE
jgi:hypothetical protein